MQVESKRRNKKLDGISHGKTVRRTTPLKASQPSNAAKVRKDIEPTKEKLRNLADRWKGVNKVRGFLTELWKALGIDMADNSQKNGGNPSRYAAFQLQDGTMLTVTIRASAHNANASTYVKDGNINGDTNISIVLQNRRKKNTFVPHDDVQLSEYVYVDDRIATVDSPLSQIALSLVGYLTNGKYVDTTGVAIPHTSPQTNDNNQLNCNLNMNKKLIRLTESDLHRIVKESVDRVLSEGLGIDYHRKVADSDRIPNEFNKNQYMEILHLLDGIGALGWLIPSSDVHSGTFGQRQRITPEMRKAIELVISNKETLKDAAANAYKSFIDRCGENTSYLNKSITNGETIKDRYFPNGDDDGYREPEEKPWYFADEEY